MCAVLAANAAPPGAVIANQATLGYESLTGVPATVLSNEVRLVTGVIRSPARAAFSRVLPTGAGSFQEPVGPAACLANGSFGALPPPVLAGGIAIDPAQPRYVGETSSYNSGEPVFIRLEDSDQNVDYTVIDYAVVTVAHAASGDTETIRLSETGQNTGVFSGYVPTSGGNPVAGDCVLQGGPGVVRLSYTDPADTADQAQAEALFDPQSVVFDSQTGEAVDGATLTLIDATSGQPATVFGNDGISIFPSTLVSGTGVTDSGGTAYAFGRGEYRFPVVPPGNYRLEIIPPDDYAAPSAVPMPDLQLLPGAPFDLGPASFGNDFSNDGNGPFRIDVPIDPQSSSLFLTKSTTTTVASPGDFVRYELVLENTAPVNPANEALIEDRLPPALRYVPGSARADGVTIDDPAVDAAGNRLTFDVGNLAAGARVRISYVVEIVGGRRNEDVVNTAVARSVSGLVSNESTARIRLVEDLFRTTSTLIGRVVEGQCSAATFDEDSGVAGIRVYLEDGRYAITDEGGRFHFEGLPPGTHIAQMDPATIPDHFEVRGCDDSGRFAGRGDSQFVDLGRGSLVRADFYLQRKLPSEGRVDIELANRGNGNDSEVEYELTLRGHGNIPVSDLEAVVLLPDGVSFVPGTARGDDAVPAPRRVGQSLTFRLGERSGNWTTTIRFTGAIVADVTGELRARALARFDSPVEDRQQTPVAEALMVRESAVSENEGYVLNLSFAVLSAELSAEDRRALDALIDDWHGVEDINITAVGHSDANRIRAESRHLFADNYVLSEARARAAANYVARALAVPAGNVQVEGRGADEPVADNDTADGRRRNRRVEMVLSGRRPARQAFLRVERASSGTVVAQTRGLVPGSAAALAALERERRMTEHLTAPAQIERHVNSLRPGIAWVTPEEGFRPSIPALKIGVSHRLDQKLRLRVNERPVNPANFDGIEVNTGRSVAVSQYAGVDLVEGPNRIVAEVVGPDGEVSERLERSVHYPGPAVRAELVEEASVLVADGKTRPMLAVRLFDRFGEPARHSTVGTFRVNQPYRSWWAVEDARTNDLVKIGDRRPNYTIGRDGVALIELEPTTASGLATLTFEFENQREQELRAYLKPAQRDWILVGFGEGTVGYSTLEDNLTAATDAGLEDGYYDDGRLAFFAKGSIRGEYLLTIAYDSARDRNVARDRFQTEVDPDEYYTLYADGSEQRFEAPSQRKLYVKLERNQFMALFGDFDTGLTATELSRYERRFNGFRSEYRGRHVDYTVFGSETDQRFVRDELQGDGTSGLYRLSGAPLVVNSETIRIEIRDRFDPARVLSTETLHRFLDYNLDPSDGTLFFKKPVPGRDENFNLVYIVAEYESRARGEADTIAGGRFALGTADDALEAGVTHIRDSQQGAEAELTGVDLRWQVGDQTLVRAELAETSRDDGATTQDSRAELVSVDHRSDRVDLRAYYRRVEEGYGLGQQSAAEKGIEKVGLDSRIELATGLEVEARAARQENIETGDERFVAEADLRYRSERTTASLGIAHAVDEFTDGEERTSDMLTAGVSQQMFDGQATLRATSNIGLGDDPANADYPGNYVLGMDYEVVPGVDLFAEYENAEGRDLEAEMTRVGVRASPWHRAQFTSSLASESSEFGPRLFANYGLIQGFQVNEQWVIDVGVDQARTLTADEERTFDPDRELASGTRREDYVAASFGTLYQSEGWSVNSRIEYRHADSEKRTSVVSGWYREPSRGHGLSAGLMLYASDLADGRESFGADLRFGWARRLAGSRWSFLDRIDLVYDEESGSAAARRSWRLVNNFNANRRIGAASQLGLQYAFKYLRSEFGPDDYTGYTDLTGIDLARGFAKRWEAGIHASVYHSWRSDVIDYGAGIDLGYNVAENLWVTLGYNLIGFHDADFSDARYTADGPYLRISIKADQATLRRIAGR